MFYQKIGSKNFQEKFPKNFQIFERTAAFSLRLLKILSRNFFDWISLIQRFGRRFVSLKFYDSSNLHCFWIVLYVSVVSWRPETLCLQEQWVAGRVWVVAVWSTPTAIQVKIHKQTMRHSSCHTHKHTDTHTESRAHGWWLPYPDTKVSVAAKTTAVVIIHTKERKA